MSTDNQTSIGIKSNRTLFRIVESIRNQGTATVTELANDTGVAKSTAHRHVASLHEEKFVIREGNEYRLGLRFLDLGTSVRNRREEYRMMKSTTRTLAEETGELVSFVVKENGRGVFLYREREIAFYDLVQLFQKFVFVSNRRLGLGRQSVFVNDLANLVLRQVRE